MSSFARSCLPISVCSCAATTLNFAAVAAASSTTKAVPAVSALLLMRGCLCLLDSHHVC